MGRVRKTGGPLAVAGEGGLDTAIAALGVPFPKVAAVVVGVKALGKAGLASWIARDEQKRQQQLETVMLNAFSALVSGDTDVAAAEVGAHIDNPNFAASVRAAAAKMAESNPCDEALRPLGLLIAAYTGMRPDLRFRRFATALSDASASSLTGLRIVVAELVKVGRSTFKVTPTPVRGNLATYALTIDHVGNVRQLDIDQAGACAAAAELLAESQIVIPPGIRPGYMGPVYEYYEIEQENLNLLQCILGIPNPKEP